MQRIGKGKLLVWDCQPCIHNLGNMCLRRNDFLGRGRGTVGKCTGPKWSKMVQTTILVKMTLFRTGFQHSRDQNGPKWSILVHFGLKRSILVHLGPPTVLWPFLKICVGRLRRRSTLFLTLSLSPSTFLAHGGLLCQADGGLSSLLRPNLVD